MVGREPSHHLPTGDTPPAKRVKPAKHFIPTCDCDGMDWRVGRSVEKVALAKCGTPQKGISNLDRLILNGVRTAGYRQFEA